MNRISSDRAPRVESSPARGDFTITFDAKGDWRALADANDWLAARDFSLGTPCGRDPMGVMHGVVRIAKWTNLDSEDRNDLHGQLTGDTRNGPLTLTMRKNAPAAVLEAFRSDPGPETKPDHDLEAREHVEGRQEDPYAGVING